LKNKTNKKSGITTYLSILTVNANVLDVTIKIQLLANWLKKGRPNYLLFTRNSPCQQKLSKGERVGKDLPSQ
jgi:hypothetical protein